MSAPEYLEIAASDLSEEALQGVLEDYVNREGTDYGEREFTLEEKVAQLRAQLRRGEVFIAFHPASDSVTLVPRS